jgi:nicotinamide-nucleotide adenylyltransferase
MVQFRKIAMIARWQPVHLGHQAVLRALCAGAHTVLIGIGSSNIYNYRCPFRLDETRDMLGLILGGLDNYALIPVPDLGDGPRWRLMVLEFFGALDGFVTANPYVASLLENDYQLVHPAGLLSADQQVAVEGEMVRREMARGGNWQRMVPDVIAEYIQNHKLDIRFRQEFGLQTLALDAIRQD